MRPPMHLRVAAVAFAFSLSLPAQQEPERPVAPTLLQGPVPEALFDTCDWRLVGPFRGGRVAAVCGVTGQRDTYWFGGTGGGVWKTTDGGKTWQNKSDGAFGGSIGAVAVAPSDPNTIYVGGGEKTWRGNVSSGDGFWKSTDGGATWTFSGLADSRHISRIRIHPQDKNLVYAAVMGHVSGPSEERGVFRSKDGGATWERVLFANAHAGAVDLCLQPDDPNVLWASTWRAIRTPWSLESGGDGSSLWQSTDGGSTWQDVSERPGLPKGLRGIIGMTVSPASPKRIWAQIEAEEGGLFRSDDGGANWTKVNDDRNLRQRAWYYTRCFADPKDADTVYVLNVQFHKSTDGGKTFSTISVPHGDNHDLWIDPTDPARMIEGNDGGACVSTDGGKSWTPQDNQPTAQFYRVTVDTAAPYRIYGAQQDNSTVRIRSQGRGAGISRTDWETTAGGESGWLAPKPDDPEIVFGGSYGGYLQRQDHRTGLSRNVTVWPDNPLGWGAGELRHRFQWNFPLLFSPHDPNLLYAAGECLFASGDQGQTWTPISGDLTRNDKTKQAASGGPITKDNTGVEYYCTIFAVAESPRVRGAIWCGSDDGLVHVTRDGGRSWTNVKPPALPEWAQINCIDAHPFVDGGCYVAATRYKLDDFRPYLYVTEDWGATWREITAGLDPRWFTRCVRADPSRRGMLYCGTERGVWLSYDDGRRWQRLQRNLPRVPITDLVVAGNDLVAATQGRSFWSFDHLEHLRQLHVEQGEAAWQLYAPVTSVLYGAGDDEVPGQGRNPERDVQVRCYIGGESGTPVTEAVAITILDFDGKQLLERVTTATDDKKKLAVQRGMNLVLCSFEFEAPKKIDGMILWSGGGGAPRLAPGDYEVVVKIGDQEQRRKFALAPDPRTTATVAELQHKQRFVVECRDVITRAHTAIETIRSLRTQMDAVIGRAEGEAKTSLEAKKKDVDGPLTGVEEALYQTKSKSSQDPLNFPIRLTDKLIGVMGAVNGAEFGPTAGQVAVKQELVAAIEAQLKVYDDVRAAGVAAFNQAAVQAAIPYVK
ncbi:MAG: glycosyl hydrolase [Planctomycetes bacterium]|nr:glycosyl hydrolase [Planctomycetota bacterium]